MVLTIIVAVMNNKNDIERMINSFIYQNYKEKELIVIDGGSNDGTIEIIKKYCDHIKYWISEPDLGIYNAWNKALKIAEGDWVCFLGSDDYLWANDVLKDVSQAIKQNPEYKIYYGKMVVIGEDDLRKKILGEVWTLENIKKHRMPPCPSTFHNVSLIKKLGYFDESFKISSDYEYMLRVLKNHKPLFMPNIIVAGFKDGGVSTKMSQYIRIVLEDMKARKKNSLCRMNVSLAFYYFILLAHIIFRDLKKTLMLHRRS